MFITKNREESVMAILYAVSMPTIFPLKDPCISSLSEEGTYQIELFQVPT
jgi:hypothetical protein